MSRRRRASGTVAAALVAFLLVTLGLVRVSEAGFGANTPSDGGWAAGRVDITDDDGGEVRFDTATDGLLDGGQALTRCLTVTYTGTLTQDVAVKMYASAAGPLTPHLDLTVEDGTGGGFGSCAGFTPARTVFSGTMAGFSVDHGTYATGAGRWDPAAPGSAKTYRITLTVQNTVAAQAKAATGTFTWEARAGLPLDAADIPGKVVWLRAKDNTGPSGSSVTLWADQSGSRRDAASDPTAPTVVTGATPIGGRAVRFAGGGGYTLADLGLRRFGAWASTVNGGFAAGNGVDGNTGTIWRSTTLPAWIAVEPRSPYAETSYTVTPSVASGGPRNFTFEGSNDFGATWTVLDSRTGVTWPSTAGQTFTFANTTPYARYRLNVATTGGATQVYLAELALNGDTSAAAAAGEMWLVVKSASTSTDSPWTFGTSGVTNRYPSGTQVHEDFGAATRQQVTTTMPVTTWRLYRVSTDGSTWRMWLDGVPQANLAGVPVTWPASATLGKAAAVASYFKGDIAEVLVRNRVATAQEEATLVRYFNAEHGLTVPVP